MPLWSSFEFPDVGLLGDDGWWGFRPADEASDPRIVEITARVEGTFAIKTFRLGPRRDTCK